jgi:hypothetical protein
MQRAGCLAARALTNELGRAFDGLASAAVDLLKELGGIASNSEEISSPAAHRARKTALFLSRPLLPQVMQSLIGCDLLPSALSYTLRYAWPRSHPITAGDRRLPFYSHSRVANFETIITLETGLVGQEFCCKQSSVLSHNNPHHKSIFGQP